MSEPEQAALIRLKAISHILGVPVDRFTNGNIPPDLVAVDECIRLLHRLRTAKGRQQALDALRHVVDDEAP